MSICLISMPWAPAEIPSIQLGRLGSYLKGRGHRVTAIHAYLEYASYIGKEHYRKINDSGLGELIFAKIGEKRSDAQLKVFAERYGLRLEELAAPLLRTEDFVDHLAEYIDSISVKMIGFSCVFNQVMPSIAVARKLKKLNSRCEIIFGGPLCFGPRGKRLLEQYREIDYIIDGDGEEPLNQLIAPGPRKMQIPGLSWRQGGRIATSSAPLRRLDFHKLKPPCYDGYFQAWKKLPNIHNWHEIALPIQGSCGCWWGKCTFCGLNQEVKNGPRFKARDPGETVEEIRILANRHRVTRFFFVDTVQHNMTRLAEKIIDADMDLELFHECRINIDKKQLATMYRAGFRQIQLGIESFSDRILARMGKGVSAIENIAAIKHCCEVGIEPIYNIITHFPTASIAEIGEMNATLAVIGHLEPPQAISRFRLDYDAPIFNNPKEYGISNIKPHPIWHAVYGEKIASRLIVSHYQYELSTNDAKSGLNRAWDSIGELVSAWRDSKKVGRLVYRDGGSFVAVRDQRFGKERTYFLDGIKRAILLAADGPIQQDRLLELFPQSDGEQVIAGIGWLEKRSIIIKKNDSILSLPTRDQRSNRC